jgi:hypothetical protein
MMSRLLGIGPWSTGFTTRQKSVNWQKNPHFIQNTSPIPSVLSPPLGEIDCQGTHAVMNRLADLATRILPAVFQDQIDAPRDLKSLTVAVALSSIDLDRKSLIAACS